MANLLKYLAVTFALVCALNAYALPEIEFNTPAVNAVKARMIARHAQLAGYYASGAVGLNLDGTIFLRDIASVPLASRRRLGEMVDAENRDRDTLYAEIANANAHPEWKQDIQNAFAPRWILHAQRGWWIMSDQGWIQK